VTNSDLSSNRLRRREISGIMVDRAIVYSKRMSAKYDIVYAVSIDTVADDLSSPWPVIRTFVGSLSIQKRSCR